MIQDILLVLVGVHLFCLIIAHICTWYYFARYNRLYPLNGFEPPISVIKPTKGVDYLAYDVFRGFCEQNYSGRYEVLFCVEDQTDPCVPVIQQIVREYPDNQWC